MFKNLEREQKRLRYTDCEIAAYLGMSEEVYVQRKRDGHFSKTDAVRLTALFQRGFDYLFFVEDMYDTGFGDNAPE